MSSTGPACGGAMGNIDLYQPRRYPRKKWMRALKQSWKISMSSLYQLWMILVVASSRDDTVGLLESLKRSVKRDGDWGHHETVAGVHIHYSRLIVDALPLHHKHGGDRSSSDIVRRWISRNDLRIILPGKDVFVVCVVFSRLVKTRKSILEAEPEKWMKLFGLVFKLLSRAVIILANMEGQRFRSGVELFVKEHGCLQQNIIYSHVDRGDIEVGSKIEDSVRSSRTPANATVMPFSMTDDLSEKMRLIWGPERVILFGRTGSGKSTLAQMLTMGDLD